MGRPELNFRARQIPPAQMQLLPLASGEFLIDGFNAGEPELHLIFRIGEEGQRELRLLGKVEHLGIRVE